MTTAPATEPVNKLFENLHEYLAAFAPDMAKRVETGLRPLFTPGVDPLSPEVQALLAGEVRPFPAQAVGVEGCVRTLRKHHNAWLIGETGTGKTYMGAWTAAVQAAIVGHPTRNIITAPNHLVRKWKRHLETVIPGARVTIVQSFADLTRLPRDRYECVKTIRHKDGSTSTQKSWRWARPTAPEFFVLPRDRGKLGYAWRPAPLVRTLGLMSEPDPENRGKRRLMTSNVPHCPKCAARVQDEEGGPVASDYFHNSKGGPGTRRSCLNVIGKKKDGTEILCNEPLWQAFNGARGAFQHPSMHCPGVSPRRMAPCVYLRKIGMRFHTYIADEVHELKGAGTLQGQMFADLCSMSSNTMLLTGTMTGGYATNLLYLMWRCMPDRMKNADINFSATGHEDYIELYGVKRETTRYIAEDDSQSHADLMLGRGKATGKRSKELPGLSPLVFVNFLMDRAVFIRLSEMHDHLPPLTEKIHELPMDAEIDKTLAEMQKQWKRHQEEVKPSRAWSAMRAMMLRWPDKPWVEPYTIYDIDPDGGFEIKVLDVPQMARKERAKERRVCQLARRNKLRGRKTWVFTELTGLEGPPAWDWMEWMASCLRKRGLRVAILRSPLGGGPDSQDREEWIIKTAPDVDVIISNPVLVQTGLDLLDFPSIIFAYCGDNTYTLRQASRRAWRLGQTKECEVDYVVYKTTADGAKSLQAAALSLMANKMASALAIEGDLSSNEGLVAMSGGDDISTQLAKFINGKLNDLEPASTAFERYRKTLERAVPNVVAPSIPLPPLRLAPIILQPNLPVQDPDVLTEPAPLPTPKRRAVREPERPAVQESHPMDPSPAPPLESSPRFGAKEPAGIRERKQQRLMVLSLALGKGASEVDGDRYRFGDQWYHLVAKARATVRERNFEDTAADRPGAIIAFVEPNYDSGPSESPLLIEHADLSYRVSFMPVSAYLAGDRTPKGTLA